MLAARRPVRRALTSPVVPLVLLSALTFALLGVGYQVPALAVATAVAGVALCGSTCGLDSAWALRASGRSLHEGLRLWGWFSAGLVLGGLLTGTLLGLLASALPWTPTTASLCTAAVLAVGLASYDLQVRSVEFRRRRWHIPQAVFLRSRAGGFFRFGLEFGSGIRTYVTSAAPYAVVLLVLLATDGVRAGVLMGACFGLGRALALLPVFGTNEAVWADDVARTSRLIERAGSVVVAAAAVWLAVRAILVGAA